MNENSDIGTKAKSDIGLHVSPDIGVHANADIGVHVISDIGISYKYSLITHLHHLLSIRHILRDTLR